MILTNVLNNICMIMGTINSQNTTIIYGRKNAFFFLKYFMILQSTAI